MLRTLLIWTALLAAPLQSAHGSEDVLEDVSALQWKYRLILVRDSTAAAAQLETARDAIDERDIVWFVLTPTGVVSNYSVPLAADFGLRLQKKYFEDTETRVILIGKDGGIKAREASLDLQGLFALIDTMPMRRREMQ